MLFAEYFEAQSHRRQSESAAAVPSNDRVMTASSLQCPVATVYASTAAIPFSATVTTLSSTTAAHLPPSTYSVLTGCGSSNLATGTFTNAAASFATPWTVSGLMPSAVGTATDANCVSNYMYRGELMSSQGLPTGDALLKKLYSEQQQQQLQMQQQVQMMVQQRQFEQYTLQQQQQQMLAQIAAFGILPQWNQNNSC